MKRFHFDLGDSEEGCLGLCASVLADSEQQAVQRLQNAFDKASVISASVDRDGGYRGTVALSLPDAEVEYLHIYLNFDNLELQCIDAQENL
jgi:hypothetical protein